MLQLNDDTGTNVQLTGFVFGVGSSANIATPALKNSTQLFLRKSGIIPKPAQIVTHIAVTADFLFHGITSAVF